MTPRKKKKKESNEKEIWTWPRNASPLIRSKPFSLVENSTYRTLVSPLLPFSVETTDKIVNRESILLYTHVVPFSTIGSFWMKEDWNITRLKIEPIFLVFSTSPSYPRLGGLSWKLQNMVDAASTAQVIRCRIYGRQFLALASFPPTHPTSLASFLRKKYLCIIQLLSPSVSNSYCYISNVKERENT